MFILTSLYAENFRSYKKIELDNLQTCGLTLISGENGSGKSSVRMLIEYIITDSISDNVPLDELSFNKKGNCKMEADFIRSDDNARIKITKYRDHSEFKNKTYLSINENYKDNTSTDRRETQDNIEALFGINKEILNMSTIFSQNSISFPASKDKDRKTVIYSIKDLDKYNVWLAKAKLYHENCKESNNKCWNDLEEYKEDIEECKIELVDLKEKEKLFDIENAKLLKKLQDELKVIEQTKNNSVIQLKDVSDMILSFENEIPDTLDDDLSKFNYEKDKIDKNILDIKDSIFKKEIEDNNIKFINSSIEDYNNELKKLNEDLENNNNNLMDKSDIAETNSELLITSDKISNLEKEIIRIETDIKIKSNELSSIENSICPILKEDCERLKSAYDDKSSEIKYDIVVLNSDVTKLKDSLASLKDKEKDFNVLLETNKDIVLGISYIDKSIVSITSSLEESKLNLKKTKEEYDKLYSKDFDIELKNLDTMLENIKNKIKKYDKFVDSKNDLEKKRIEYKFINEKIDECEKTIKEKNTDIDLNIKQENVYIQFIKREKEKITNSKRESKRLSFEINKLTNDLEYYKFWIEGFSPQGIPNLESEFFINDLEDETNRILSDFDTDIFVKLGGQSVLKSKEIREKISYEVISTSKEITNFFSYSSGQRQRVLFSDKIAFNTLLGKFNFIILDEILELSLDDKGKEATINFLKYINDRFNFMFVISHDHSIKNIFDNTIEAKITNGVSTLIMN